MTKHKDIPGFDPEESLRCLNIYDPFCQAILERKKVFEQRDVISSCWDNLSYVWAIIWKCQGKNWDKCENLFPVLKGFGKNRGKWVGMVKLDINTYKTRTNIEEAKQLGDYIDVPPRKDKDENPKPWKCRFLILEVWVIQNPIARSKSAKPVNSSQCVWKIPDVEKDALLNLRVKKYIDKVEHLHLSRAHGVYIFFLSLPAQKLIWPPSVALPPELVSRPPPPPPPPPPPTPGIAGMRTATYNVRRTRNRRRGAGQSSRANEMLDGEEADDEESEEDEMYTELNCHLCFQALDYGGDDDPKLRKIGEIECCRRQSRAHWICLEKEIKRKGKCPSCEKFSGLLSLSLLSHHHPTPTHKKAFSPDKFSGSQRR